MTKRIFFRFLFVFLCPFSSTSEAAQQDSVQTTSFKIFLQGAFSTITKWESQKGRLYSENWYEREEPKTYSTGYRFGILVSKKIFPSVLAGAGVEFVISNLDNFRTSPAPDTRYSNKAPTDTSYSNYIRWAYQIPVFLQFSAIRKNSIHLVIKIGTVSDYTLDESYDVKYTGTTAGGSYSDHATITNSNTNFTGTRLQLGIDLELKNRESHFILLFGGNLITGPFTPHADKEYELHYGSVFSISAGLGYAIYKKSKVSPLQL
jgi:hypothetical protein